MEYKELQKKAKELGVKATGTEEELKERIREVEQEEETSSDKGRERTYFFPDKKVSIKASSKKEAYDKIKEI